MSQIKSITQVVNSIKSVLELSHELKNITCSGEISNLTKHASGHWYFSLKDSKSKINCVMFRRDNLKVNHSIADGDEVIVTGMVTIYGGNGQVQLVLSTMQLAGQGALYKKYLMLRDKLNKEGYFSKEHKKTLVKYPDSIGIISGHNSAALADILQTLSNRWPIAKISIYESLVQGSNAPENIINNLKIADQEGHDVIILGRGGGSLEDLWAFNNEELVKTIYHAKTPIVTGVGHEIDITLVDYVADLRGLTPTAAAQLATPDKDELLDLLASIDNHLINKTRHHFNNLQLSYENTVARSILKRPNLLFIEPSLKLQELSKKLDNFGLFITSLEDKIVDSQQKLLVKSTYFKEKQIKLISDYQSQLQNKWLNNLSSKKHDLQNMMTQLDLKSPLTIMKKGYLLSYQEGKLITNANQVNDQKQLNLQYYDGLINVKVLKNGVNNGQ
ncbi:MAG: exodeoxyribonuclease VII large subunit [Erysipelothrix sp.]|nr:exodeoxyribonuclease VII large subunit [Erysipelothrix sp.]